MPTITGSVYPAPLPSPDRIHASLVAIVKRIRKDGRRSTRPDRTAAIRGEYAAEILEVIQAHIAAASVTGGIHPLLAPSIRQWLQGRKPVYVEDCCPDCGQVLSTPAQPVLSHNGFPVWCAFCEDSRPRRQEVIDSCHSEAGG